MRETRILGITGWSGSGKTTLLTRLLPLFVRQGLRVATLKHAHHDFEIDRPGKDSHAHRLAGASEVIISSARRWAQIHELGTDDEATLPSLLGRLSPCDLVLVEGYKREPHPKLEVFRPELGKPPLHVHDATVAVVASSPVFALPDRLCVDLNDVAAVADAVLAAARPLPEVLASF